MSRFTKFGKRCLLAAVVLSGLGFLVSSAQAQDYGYRYNNWSDSWYGYNGVYSPNAINFLFGSNAGYRWQPPVRGYEEIEYNRRRLDALYNPNYGIYSNSNIKLMFGGLGGGE